MCDYIKQTGKTWGAVLLLLLMIFSSVPAFATYTIHNVPTAGNLFGTEAQRREAERNQQYDGAFYGQHQTGEDGVPVNRSLITMCDEAGLMNRIVKCVANIAVQSASRFFDNTAVALQSYTLAMSILAVTLFGAQLLMGSIQRPGGEAFTLLLKIAFVLFVMATAEEVVTRVVGVFETIEEIAMSLFETTSGAIGEFSCENNDTPFLIIDCVLEQFINSDGTTVYNGETYNDPAFMILMQVSATTSVYGFIVAIALGVMLFLVLLLALRCTMLYISNVLILVILLAVTPIFTPLILFKITKDKFDKLVLKLITTILQPLLLFVFVCFTFNVVDNLLFRHEQYSLSSILGVDWRTADAEPPISGGDLEAKGTEIEEDVYYESDSLQYDDYYQTYATEHTVTGVGDIKIQKENLITIEVDMFENALRRVGSGGAAVGKIIDEFIEDVADKIAENLIPIKIYRMEPLDGRTNEEIHQELMSFSLILFFLVPTFLYFTRLFPDMLRALSRTTGQPLWNTPIDKAVAVTAKTSVAATKGAVVGAAKGMMKGGPKAALAQAAIGAAKEAGKTAAKNIRG